MLSTKNGLIRSVVVFMTISTKRSDADNEFLTFDRIVKIRSVIEKYGEESCYLSFSGGKDSTVLSHLLDKAIPGNKVTRAYMDTGIDYALMRRHIVELQKNDPRIVMVKPAVNIKTALERDGYPFKSKEHSMYVGIYQNSGFTKSVERYLYPDESRKTFGCPDSLRYQFTDEFKLKCSKKCCFNMKEKPLADFAKANGKKVALIGILGDEKGGRSNAKCMSEGTNGEIHFQPLTAVDSEWEEWYIQKEQIKLSPLYYPPYSLKRTGCKGCPMALDLQENLDVLGLHFPNERKQCELIWGPVYDEYRRLGYRLKRKGEMKGQITLFDFMVA